MQFTKPQLDLLATILGCVIGVSTVMTTQEIGSQKFWGAVGGVAAVFLGVVTQRPANKHPTTEDLEPPRRTA